MQAKAGAFRLARLDHHLLAGLAGLLTLLLYLRTLAPSVMWYDMAEMAAAAYHLGIAHHTGYPLYVLLGKLFTLLPFGDPAYRVNLMSAVFASATVVVVFLTVWVLTHRRTAALLASLTLGVGSTLWSNATLAESYPLNAFFVALLTYLMLTWQRTEQPSRLRWAFYLLGLAMGNHHLIQFFGPALLVYWATVHWHRQRHLPWRELPRLAGLFLLGFAINLYLPIRAMQRPEMMWADASDLRTWLEMITVGKQKGSILVLPTASVAVARVRAKTLLLYPLYELTFVGLGLAIWGAVRLGRCNRPLLWHGLVGGGLTLAMILLYSIHNIFQYFLPIYVVMSVWLGMGVSGLLDLADRWEVRQRAGKVTSSRGFYALVTGLLLCALPVYLVSRDFTVLDRSQDYSAYDYASYLSARLEPNATLDADFWAWAPLAYYQTIGGWRPDVDISAELSMPEFDWNSYGEQVAQSDEPHYLVAGLYPIPEDYLSDLIPTGLGVAEGMTTFGVPAPVYKDVWLALKPLYRVRVGSADAPLVEPTLDPAFIAVHFGDLASLLGFQATRRELHVGDWLTLTFHWRLDAPTDHDLYARLRLVDADGNVQLVRQLAVWDGSHVLGGADPTSTWAPGRVIGESLDVIIPWRVQPGEYRIQLWLYEDSVKSRLLLPAGAAQPKEGLSLGDLRILARE